LWIAISSERRLKLHGHGLLAAALKDNESSRKRKQSEERSEEHLPPPARQAQTLLRLRCGLGCPQQQLQASLELGRTQSSNIEPKHIASSIARQSAPTPPNREYRQRPFLSSEVESPTHPHCQREKNMLWNTMEKTTLCIRRTGPSGRSKSSHPHKRNTSMPYLLLCRLGIGAILAYTCLCSTFTSSIFSTATKSISAEFHVSIEVAVISSSLYILGYAFGPLVWGPFSELEGRKLPILIGMFGFMIFNFAVAVAKDLQTVMICRFWSGFFGSCPLSVVAAVFADIFDNKQRGPAIVVFASCVFMGPLLGPFIGGFIILNHSLGWRWTSYITGIMGALSLGLNVLFLSESYPPVVLVAKAAELRRRTKNWGIHAKQEEVEVDFQELITKNFSRPIRLLITEPVVLLVTIYMSFIYGLLYCFLTAYPIIFQGVHGFNPGIGGLPFFGMVCGVCLAGGYVIYTSTAYNKKLMANAGMPIPEWRLPPVIIGGGCFAAGLFWLGWTGYTKSIHWIVPTLSGLLTGFGLLAIFIQLFNYIIDSYLML